jgi:Ni/Fe-hydrogenase subunit HybB-like protein
MNLRWLTLASVLAVVGVAMAVLILLGILLRSQLGIESYLGASQFHDMGNLLLGFALFSMGLFFAQYLTIWYADLPMETGFLIRRYLKGPWPPLGWIAFVVGYGIPFLMLIPKQAKMNLRWLTLASVLAVVGVALERYVLVVPSILPHRLMASPLSGLVFIGLTCAFIVSLLLFLKRYSPISTAEAALYPAESVETSL